MPTLLFSSRDSASANIASHMVGLGFDEDGEGRWKYGEIPLLDTLVERMLDVPTDFETDCIIVLSLTGARQCARA